MLNDFINGTNNWKWKKKKKIEKKTRYTIIYANAWKNGVHCRISYNTRIISFSVTLKYQFNLIWCSSYWIKIYAYHGMTCALKWIENGISTLPFCKHVSISFSCWMLNYIGTLLRNHWSKNELQFGILWIWREWETKVHIRNCWHMPSSFILYNTLTIDTKYKITYNHHCSLYHYYYYYYSEYKASDGQRKKEHVTKAKKKSSRNRFIKFVKKLTFFPILYFILFSYSTTDQMMNASHSIITNEMRMYNQHISSKCFV